MAQGHVPPKCLAVDTHTPDGHTACLAGLLICFSAVNMA